MRPARPFSRLLKAFRLKSARLLIIATLVTIGAGLSWFEPPFILQAREWVWDEMVRVKPRAWDPGLKVRIVNIDEQSLAAHGQWPWPRARMARLVDSLKDYGARAVAFDVIFAEPDRTSLGNIFDGLRRDVPGYQPPLDAESIARQPDNDAILAAAIGRIPTVLALSVEETESPNGSRPLANLPRVEFERRKDQRYLAGFPGAISALPILQEQAASNASIDPRVDPDGITRRAALLYKVGKRTVPSLAAALVLAANGGGVTALTRQPGLRAIAIGSTEIPTDRYGQMRLYDSGSKPGVTFPRWMSCRTACRMTR
ncbi:MAG: CHASE2 domain-containing protein [Proteobacteria bacterium]|nr:CHASE2 domain-containing protein [Pseudomonadota bacterium]